MLLSLTQDVVIRWVGSPSPGLFFFFYNHPSWYHTSLSITLAFILTESSKSSCLMKTSPCSPLKHFLPLPNYVGPGWVVILLPSYCHILIGRVIEDKYRSYLWSFSPTMLPVSLCSVNFSIHES